MDAKHPDKQKDDRTALEKLATVFLLNSENPKLIIMQKTQNVQVSPEFRLQRDLLLSQYQGKDYLQKISDLCRQETSKSVQFLIESCYTTKRTTDWDGTFHQIFHGKKLLGSFYFDGEKWCGTPYYKESRFLLSDEIITAKFNFIQYAVDYILSVYTSEIELSIAA